MSFLDHIRACNAHDPAAFRPFEVDGCTLGHVLTAFMGRLAAFPDIFLVEDDKVVLRPAFQTPEERTAAMRRAKRRMVSASIPDRRAAQAASFGWPSSSPTR